MYQNFFLSSLIIFGTLFINGVKRYLAKPRYLIKDTILIPSCKIRKIFRYSIKFKGELEQE